MKLYAALDVFDDREENKGVLCEDASRAIQSQAGEADINVIVARFLKTGAIAEVPMPPVFGDFTSNDEYLSFQEAQNMVLAAKQSFMALDAKVRGQFNDDPGAFVDFATDPKNIDQMRLWGLAIPEVVIETPVTPGA